MALEYVGLFCLVTSMVLGKPLEGFRDASDRDAVRVSSRSLEHRLFRRFVDPSILDNLRGSKNLRRTARSMEDECERLELCKLHAAAPRSFLASYGLYFVNKENAKLWDHQSHSAADCDRLYAACYGRTEERQPARHDYISPDYY